MDVGNHDATGFPAPLDSSSCISTLDAGQVVGALRGMALVTGIIHAISPLLFDGLIRLGFPPAVRIRPRSWRA